MPGSPFRPMNLIDLILKAFARAFGRAREDAGDDSLPVAATAYASPLDIPVLDLGVFKELHATLGSNTDRLRNVYVKFLDSAAKRIEELRRQPIPASLQTLHALKGSAGMVGASRLAALAAHLQETTADRQSLTEAVDDIQSELTKFNGVLSTQLDSVSR